MERQSKSGRESLNGLQVSQRLIRKYGSVKAVLKENEKLQKMNSTRVGCLQNLIHPYSTFRFLWDLMMILLILIIVYTFPIFLAFPAFDFYSPFGHESSCGHRYTAMTVNIITDIIFATDILLNFRTGIVENEAENTIIMDAKRIRKAYLKGWFTIDLISTVPVSIIWEAIGGASSSDLAVMKVAKLFQLLRLIRLTKVFRTKHQWKEIELFQNDTAIIAVKLLGVVAIILTFCHLSACCQFLVPLLYDIPPDTWIAFRNLEYKEFYIQYLWSMFRAISQMICIGYGLFPPVSRLDKIVTISMMIIGAILFAACIGILTSIVQSHNASKRLYKEKIASVKQYMSFRKLPVELRKRITDYYENRYQGKMFNEDQIKAELNPSLRQQLLNASCRELIDAVPMFLEFDEDFIDKLLTKLKFEVYLFGDEIIRQGTLGRKMFFISRGTVRILSFKNLNNSQVLSDGEYFGEIALLHPTKRRTASIFAESYCYMYSLDVDDMNQVLEMFPHIRRQFMAEAQNRLEAIEEEERKMLQNQDQGMMSYEMSKASVQDWYKRSSNMKGRMSTRNASTFSRASQRGARPMGLSDFVNARQSQAQRRGTIMRM